MQKNIIRISALLILASPWIYIGSTLKQFVFIFIGIALLLATVDISKKKKEESVI